MKIIIFVLGDELITLNAIALSAADQTRWPGFLGDKDSLAFFRYTNSTRVQVVHKNVGQSNLDLNLQ